MRSRTPDRAAWGTLALLTVLLVGAAAWMVPWTAWAGPPAVRPAPAADFTPAQLARDTAFHAALRSWTYPRLAIVLLTSVVLGLTPLGARLAARAGRWLGGSWPATVVAGTVAVTAATSLAALPLSVAAEVVLRRYGLSTQGWSGWTADLLRGTGVTAAVSSLVLAALVGLARRWPRRWWAPGAGLAAVLVVAGSTLYPVLIEPLANDFRPLAAGPQRTALLELAARDGQPVRDVLVADASRRTTAENAYVSGLGSTRRLVVYDTLLRKASPAEVQQVVAHELGHVAHRDVLRGTAMGALGAAWAVVALALLTRRRGWARHAGVDAERGLGDPRAVAFLLALFAVGSVAVAPMSTLVSRRLEARADVHALDLTRDPGTFSQVQRRLAVQNLSDLQPRWYREALFETHPSPPWRVALARAWARQQRVPGPAAPGAPAQDGAAP